MKTPNYVFDDELYHYGILGQRWGHRRFQNEDGSWTPEGRERYSEGERERFAAKDAYKTQKYKAKLESRAIKDAARRAAKEDRYRIRQQAKSDKLARDERSKLDRDQARLNRKLSKEQLKEKDSDSINNILNRTKKYSMSNDELARAIDRLKLEAEYNKQYVLATKPNSALVKADRFFDSPTGRAVMDLSKAVLPNIATQVSGKVADKLLADKKQSEADKLDLEKKRVDIESTKANIRKANAEAAEKEAKATISAQEKHREEVKARAEKMFGKNESNVQQPKQQVQPQAPKVKSSDDTNKDFYSRIEKGVANATNKAANSLFNTASGEIKKHAETFSNEAKRGVKEGVNEAIKDLLGPSNKMQTKSVSSIPVYNEEEMFRILKGLGRIK